MIVYLLSNGACNGIHTIEMREPRIGDLREQYSPYPELKKTQFVKRLMRDPQILDDLTLNDRDWLFMLAASSISIGRFDYSIKCDCSHINQEAITINEAKCDFLDPDTKLSCTKKIGDTEYTFRKLLVKDEIAAIEALPNIDNYEQTLVDLMVGAALNMPIDSETIHKVHSLDIAVYYAVLLWQEAVQHSAKLSKTSNCRKCNAIIPAYVAISPEMIDIPITTIMGRYANLSSKIDFNSFMDLTFTEYNVIVAAFNEQISKFNQSRKNGH